VAEQMTIKQGDIFWIPIDDPNGAQSDFIHPHVVIDHGVDMAVVVCALTTNMKRAKAPGNVLLEAGEANLPRQSIVVVSQVSTVNKTQLGTYIGSLSDERIHQILAGMKFLNELRGAR
jgi:mRNA interferase MazF